VHARIYRSAELDKPTNVLRYTLRDNFYESSEKRPPARFRKSQLVEFGAYVEGRNAGKPALGRLSNKESRTQAATPAEAFRADARASFLPNAIHRPNCRERLQRLNS
jgi:hypothetical protein